MVSFTKLVSALSLVGLGATSPTLESARSLWARHVSLCNTAKDNLTAIMPSDINTRGGRPLLPPIADAPTWVALSVGVQNYTCSEDGTWAAFGAVTELFDISCIPLTAQASFTTFVHDLWLAAPPETTALDLIAQFDKLNPPYALGQHYFVPNRGNASDPDIYAKWDFSSAVLKHDQNAKNAYAVGVRTGQVPSPDDPAHDADWLSLTPLLVDGKPDGELRRPGLPPALERWQPP